MRLGLRGRMLAASAVLALLVAGVFLVLILQIRGEQQSARLEKESADVTAVANELERFAIELQTSVRGYAITGQQRFLEPWIAARAGIPARTRELEALITVPRQQARLREIVRGIREYEQFGASVLAASRIDLARGRAMIATGDGKQRLDSVRAQFAAFLRAEEAIANDRQRRADADRRRAIMFAFGALAGSVLLVLVFAAFLARSIVAPVRRIAGAADRLARGDLSARVPSGGTAEIGELGRTFNEMAGSLEESRDELETQHAELEAQQAELEEALVQLGEEKERIAGFYEVGGRLAAETELDTLTRTALAQLSDFADAEIGTLYARETEEDPEFALLAARGLDTSRLPARLGPGEGLAGRAVEERRTVVVSHAGTGLRLPVFGDDVAVHHEAHVPLLHGDSVLGVVTLARVADRPFSAADLSALDHLGAQAAVAVTGALAFETARRIARLNSAVLDATTEGITLVDPDGRPLVTNETLTCLRRDVFGLPDESTVAESAAAIMDRLEDGTSLASMLEAVAADPDSEARATIALADSGRAFDVYTAPVPNEEAGSLGRIFTLRETTAEREAERLKSDLVATVSHELRTPLASILGFAELLVTRELDDGTRRDYLDTIYGEATRLTTLINDFLDLQRIEEGAFRLALEPFDLAAVLEEQARIFSGQSAAHSFALDLPDEPLVVLGERARVGQVVGNLVSNAIKYSPDGGTVAVSASTSANAVRVSVADEGLGIPADQQAQLFEKFFRVDSAERRAIGGTGLGLALCRDIVEAHGGRIGFESVEGEGSTFWFELPAARGDGPRNGRPRVLVVEDDPAAASFLSACLTADGYVVDMAASGEQALALATGNSLDLVCLDIVLPGELDGWQVLSRLKQNPATASIPVVVCTGKNGRERAGALGAADFLAKPFSRQALREALDRIVSTPAGSVLVVDDDRAVRALVGEMLRPDGIAVREAADGVEALAEIAAQRPDAIVLDLLMPRLDGFAVLERLREDEEMRSIPTIVLTAHRLSPEERQALQAGAAALLEKSAYSAVELRRLVKQALGSRVSR